jgi:hypothetical protein
MVGKWKSSIFWNKIAKTKGIGKAIKYRYGYEKRFPDFLDIQLGLAFAQNEVGIKEKFWIPKPETIAYVVVSIRIPQ